MKIIGIHDDRLGFLRELGPVSIKRASHVEPTDDAKWTADLSPVDGPVLGPFDTRGEALDAEVAWLKKNHLPCASGC